MQEQFLPLFPLPLVLLPHTEIPLHIFEERYKEMIGEAIRDSSEFGIVLAAEKGILNTGCTAVVAGVTQQYPDGRMDIICRGVRRFRIRSVNSEQPCLRARVEFFDDEMLEEAPHPLRVKAAAVARDFLAHGDAALEQMLDAEAGDLSYRIASLVDDAEFRQQLLVTRSEAERLDQIMRFVPLYALRRQYSEQVRAVAPTNGRGKHPPNLDAS